MRIGVLRGISPIFLLSLPFFAGAVSVESSLGTILTLLQRFSGTLIILATLYFLWGVLQIVFAGGDEKKITDAKGVIVWGVVGLFLMISFWGIVTFMQQTIGIDDPLIIAPTVPGKMPK